MADRRRPHLSNAALVVTVSDARGRRVSGTGLERWLPIAAPRRARGRVGIALVDDRTMRAFNRRYRNADYATDVLSFPVESGRQKGGVKGRSVDDLPLLGDIVIARGVAARQARRFGHAPGQELRILALHGLLHLLGYDHEADDGTMRRVEERLRRQAGLPTGLTARARSTARPR